MSKATDKNVKKAPQASSKQQKDGKKVKRKLQDFGLTYHKVVLIDTEGCKISTYSTYGKDGQEIKLETCPKSHSAWKSGVMDIANSKDLNVKKFNSKYGNISSSDLV
ncbi:50S ribosomal protein L31 [Candidatus Deianiraea vastatrix]|nr:50S ribosomal protein L31 [Candidatus Deianiraea vastatrix]